MQDNEITKFTKPSLVPTPTEKARGSSPSGFVPNLKLLQPGSKECKEKPKDFHAGEYIFNDQKLGDKVKIAVVGRRNHAIRFESNQKTLESFDPTSEAWEQIANTKRDFDQGINALFGSEWLIWLCDHGEFATLHAGKASFQDVTDEISYLLSPPENRPPAFKDLPQTRVMWLRSELKTFGAKLSAFGPAVSGISEKEAGDSAIPTEDECRHVEQLFYAPVEAEASAVEVSDDDLL